MVGAASSGKQMLEREAALTLLDINDASS
jgi:hypothetical protein